MIWFYRLLFLPLLLIALPWYWWRMRQRGGYQGSTIERLGLGIDCPPRAPGKVRIWVQAVSVGEVGAIEPLLRELAHDGRIEFVFTTTTSTGQAIARQRLGDLCAWIGWFPVDFVVCSRQSWRRLEPDAAFLMEGELWPEHLRQARRRGVPVYVINARLSERSFRRYQRFRAVTHSLSFRHVSMILAATVLDAERWKILIPRGKVVRTGNLKLDLPPVDAAVRRENRRRLLTEFGFAPGKETEPVVLFGNSTWPGEEAMLVDVWRQAAAAGLSCGLVIVPRHAERREEIRAVLEARDVAYHFRSESALAPGGNQVYVGDTTGELLQLLQAADVVFVGKSLPPHEGGQNPIEAVSLGLPVIFGPRMSNFREIADGMVREGVARAGQDAVECADELMALLRDPVARDTRATAAKRWLARHRGALQRAAELLRAELDALFP